MAAKKRGGLPSISLLSVTAMNFFVGVGGGEGGGRGVWFPHILCSSKCLSLKLQCKFSEFFFQKSELLLSVVQEIYFETIFDIHLLKTKPSFHAQ